MTKKKKRYSEDDITYFKRDTDKIRSKPQMYIGPTDDSGVFTILREPCDNAVDEARAGRNDLVHIFVNNGVFTVVDAGEGIPVKLHKTAKISTLTHVFTNLQSSGKMKSGAYESAIGCFVGDTELRLLDGTITTFEQLYDRWQTDKSPIPIMSWSTKNDKIAYSNISHVQLSKYVDEIIEVELSSGAKIRCTVDHPFYVRRCGEIKKIKAFNLKSGDSCVSVHFKRDHDGYLYSNKVKVARNGSSRLHRSVYQFYNGVKATKGNIVHHINRLKQDNRPENLELMSSIDHQIEHEGEKRQFSRHKMLLNNKVRGQKAKLMSCLNHDPELNVVRLENKILKSGVRALLKSGKLSRSTYSKYKTYGCPTWDNIENYMTMSQFRSESSAILSYHIGRKHTHKASRDFLNRLKSYKSNASDIAFMNSMKALFKLWFARIERLEDTYGLEAITPKIFNADKSGVGVLGAYALMRKFTSLKELVCAYSENRDPALYDDLSYEAQEERAYKAEAKIRGQERRNRIIHLFGLTANRNKTYTESTYDDAKSVSSPCWKLAVACLDIEKGISNSDEITDFIKEYNFSVTGVTRIRLRNKIPVYGITVDKYHKYFVEPGVLVANTHGVGQKATNALSEFLEVWTYRKDAGGWHYTKFERGIEVVKVKKSNPPKIDGNTFKRGTVVRFKPDDKIFGKAKLSLEQLRTWCEITSYMNAGLNIKLTTKKGTKSWVSKNGIKGYLDKRLTDLKASPLNKEPLAYTSKNIELALSFADVEGEECMFFTNTIRNIDRGFHADALFKALSDSLKPYKGKLEYQPSDLREGLVGILNYKIDAPQFSSQTKEKLVDIRVKDMAYKELLDVFDDYFKKNKSLAKQLVERAAELRKKTADFLKDKKLIKNVKTAQRALAAKLADIVGNKVPVEERELFLVEGDSAGGSCKVARYRDFQAVFSLKGKPLNVMETTKDKVNANKEIAGIFASLGLDLSKPNPADSIRYGRIIFLSDPDVDGGHINCLLMTLFWKYLPDLFKQGRIYLVASPEYITKYKGKLYFGFTKDEIYKQVGTDKVDIRHLKGWGECPAEYLKPLVFDKQERAMFRVMPPVDREGALRFSALMGKDSSYRKVIFGVSNVSEKEALKKCQGRKAKQKAEKQPTKKRKARKNK